MTIISGKWKKKKISFSYKILNSILLLLLYTHKQLTFKLPPPLISPETSPDQSH